MFSFCVLSVITSALSPPIVLFFLAASPLCLLAGLSLPHSWPTTEPTVCWLHFSLCHLWAPGLSSFCDAKSETMKAVTPWQAVKLKGVVAGSRSAVCVTVSLHYTRSDNKGPAVDIVIWTVHDVVKARDSTRGTYWNKRVEAIKSWS